MTRFIVVALLAALLAGCDDFPLGHGEGPFRGEGHGWGRGHGHGDDFADQAQSREASRY